MNSLGGNVLFCYKAFVPCFCRLVHLICFGSGEIMFSLSYRECSVHIDGEAEHGYVKN